LKAVSVSWLSNHEFAVFALERCVDNIISLCSSARTSRRNASLPGGTFVFATVSKSSPTLVEISYFDTKPLLLDLELPTALKDRVTCQLAHIDGAQSIYLDTLRSEIAVST
jgi:hypothetical protein